MAKYTCISTFSDSKGVRFSSGQSIDSTTYDCLALSEQTKFSKDTESSSSSPFSPIANASNFLMGDMLGSGLPGGYDLDVTTPW